MSITRRILLFICIVLPVLLVALYSYRHIRQRAIERIYEERSSLASLSVRVLKERLDHLRDLGLSISTRPLIRQLVVEQKWEAAADELMQVSNSFPYIDRVFIADTTGALMGNGMAIPTRKAQSYAKTDAYKKFMKTHQPYLSEVYNRGEQPHEIVAAFILPVKNEGGKLLGIFVMQVNIAELTDWRNDVSLGKSGFVYVVDHKGHIAVNPEYAYADSIIDYSSVPAVQKALKGEKNVEILYNPIAKEERLKAYEQIPGYGWVVIVQQEAGAALSGDNSLWYIAFIYLIIILLVIALAWFIIREVTKYKKTEIILTRSNKSLEQRVNENTAFLYQVVEDLKESTERFHYATRATNEIIYDCKLDDNVVWWNDRYYSLTGIEKEKGKEWLTLDSWTNFIHPEDKDRILKSGSDFLESKETYWAGEYRFIDKKGNVYFFDDRAYVIRDQNGRPFRVIGAITDITERKKADAAFRESQKIILKIIHSFPIGFLLQGPAAEIFFSNEPALTMLGLTEDQLLGKTSFDKDWNVIREDGSPFPGPDHPVPQAILKKKPMRNVVMGVYRPKTKDRIWLLVNALPELDTEGNVLEVICSFSDITELIIAKEIRKQADEKLRQLASHLHKVREEERTRIAREIHDELGQQLTGLRMDASWLRKKINPEEEEIKKKFKEMIGLIDNTVKSVRRISTELRPGILDDLGLLEALEWQSDEFEKHSGIKTTFTSSINELKLKEIVTTGIFRIYQETLTNVARHSQATEVLTTLITSNGNILLRISDNGKGMDESELIHKKTFGLVGMKERAAMMGGELTIESESGKGTAILLNVPVNS